MEKKFQIGGSPSQAASSCISNSTLLSQVQKCVTGDIGNQLMHKNAVETKNLNPPHKYVPWVVVDGKPNTDITEDMLGWVCNNYKGTKPPACKKDSKKCYKYGIINE
jgi:hypothetical protein